ncbi:MAG TPA: pitrilysin family protein [Pyrinomonadaceae bacterium]|nr:pitrilysin family protein [Pyrinomonadaceae bacterium]
MRNRSLPAIFLVLALLAPAMTFAQRKTGRGATGAWQAAVPLPPIKVTEFKLKNGLRVILHEDHSTPIVGVNLWYHVGSKNEVPGKTGFAHLFEHMMFQGSKNYDDDYFKPIQEAGGTLNGSTNPDRTNYFEVVPSNFLELALFMEADRMGGLLDVINETKLANQRDVVKNEKRQNYDNTPYGLIGAKINETLYPASHPYHWLTIGSLEDLTAASMEDVKDFFRRYYTPRNASLAIAGDFNPAEARRLVEKHFGKIAGGPPVTRPNAAQPVLTESREIVMQDRVAFPRLYLVWPTRPAYDKDEAATDTLANILGGGKSSRLYKTLVYDRQIAQDVNAGNNAQEIAGRFQITATARPGKTLEELESAINAEVEKIKKEGPTQDEVDRSYNATEAAFIFRMQTLQGKNDQLNQYATFVGKPAYFQQDLSRYRRVTPEDVKRAANAYLIEHRLKASVVPQGKERNTTSAPPAETPPSAAETAAAAQATKRTAESPAKWKLPTPKADPRLTLPQIQRHRLSNGLEVVVVEHHELPVVTMNLVVKSGSAADPQNRAGLASLTADLLDEGTKKRSALEISNALTDIGARLGTAADWDSNSANITTLSRHVDRALDIYADVLTNPAFLDDELKRMRARRLNVVKQQRDNAGAIASVVYASILYGRNHPYGHPAIGDEDSLKDIKAADVRGFYETFYRPNNASLIVVGDVKSETILPKLERAFAGWQRADVPTMEIPNAHGRERAGLYIVDRPGSAQSVINIGQVGVARSTPDYFPLLVLNTMLGGQFVSRVNLNLREDKGYTYGARTAFDYRRGAGPFVASAGVFTNVTKQSIAEFMKELRGVRGEIPITEKELEFSKQAIIRGYPRGFETPGQIANRLSDVVLYGLPDDYFNNYIQKVRGVTLADVQRVANRYLDPSKMAILVVGDRKVIEPGLRSLEAVGTTITFVDMEGKPVAVRTMDGGDSRQ